MDLLCRKVSSDLPVFYCREPGFAAQENGTTYGEFMLLQSDGVEFSGYDFGVDWDDVNIYIDRMA
jgi:hypothetical protein